MPNKLNKKGFKMKPSILYNGYKNTLTNRIKLKLYEILFNIADRIQSISYKRNDFVFDLASTLRSKALGEITPF